jgi:hypothetical protein
VGEAAAEDAGHCLLNLGAGRLRILIEEGLRREDHAVQAVAALRRLLLDEGALDGMRPLDVPSPSRVVTSASPTVLTGVTHERIAGRGR